MIALVDLSTCEWIVCATACIPIDEGVWTSVDICVYIGKALTQNLDLLIVRPESYVCCLGLVQISCAQDRSNIQTARSSCIEVL